MNPLILEALVGAGGEGAAASGASQAIQQVTQQIQGMQGPANQLNEALALMQVRGSAATTVITTLGNAFEKIPVIGPQIQQLSTAFGTLEGQLKSLNQFVAGFSPLDSKLLDRAFADMNAAFGEQLIPVIRDGTQLVRWLGDEFAGLTPVVRPLIEQGLAALKPILQSIGDTVHRTIEALTPLVPVIEHAFSKLNSPENVQFLQQLGDVIVEVTRETVEIVIAMDELGLMFGDTTIYMRIFTEHLRNMLELLKLNAEYNPFMQLGRERSVGETKLNGDATGKAFVTASQTSPDALLTRMQTQAFGLGSNTPEEKTASNTERSASYLKLQYDYFTSGRFVAAIKDALTPPSPKNAAGELIRDSFSGGRGGQGMPTGNDIINGLMRDFR